MKALLLVAASLLLSAIPIGSVSARQSDDLRDWMTLGTEAVSTFNGVLSDPVDPSTRQMIDLYQESLVDWRDNEIVGELAESFIPLGDAGIENGYLFHLNPAATWSDGTPFTADDVVFTFDAVLDAKLASPYHSPLRNVLAPVDRPYYAEGTDIFVVITKVLPQDEILAAMRIPIVARHVWENIPFDRWSDDPGSTGEDSSRVVGTGQYQFESRTRYRRADCGQALDAARPAYAPDEDIRFLRNPFYGSGNPAWSDRPGFALKVYACAQGAYDPGDRIDLAKSREIVDGRSLTALRMPGMSEGGFELPGGGNPVIAPGLPPGAIEDRGGIVTPFHPGPTVVGQWGSIDEESPFIIAIPEYADAIDPVILAEARQIQQELDEIAR